MALLRGPIHGRRNVLITRFRLAMVESKPVKGEPCSDAFARFGVDSRKGAILDVSHAGLPRSRIWFGYLR